jgi:hypothetical protein
MRLKLLCVLAFNALLVTGRADAGLLLDSSVSFDPSTKLYTYAYTLDNRSGSVPINELSVLVDSAHIHYSFTPPGHSEPAGWSFVTAVSGGIANPPYNEFGTFWQWHSDTGVAAGGMLDGFSFTSTLGPTNSGANNYFLFSNVVTGSALSDGIVEYGHVLAPDFRDASEPGTWLLFTSGIVTALGMKRRRQA